jgi:hypothetical protein
MLHLKVAKLDGEENISFDFFKIPDQNPTFGPFTVISGPFWCLLQKPTKSG